MVLSLIICNTEILMILVLDTSQMRTLKFATHTCKYLCNPKNRGFPIMYNAEQAQKSGELNEAICRILNYEEKTHTERPISICTSALYERIVIRSALQFFVDSLTTTEEDIQDRQVALKLLDSMYGQYNDE